MSQRAPSFVESGEYKLFLKGLLEAPSDLYAKMRVEDPVHWSPELGSWILTRYDDIRLVSQFDARISADRLYGLFAPLGGADGFETLHHHLRTWVVFTDPPAHTAMRDSVKRHLAPVAVASYAPRVQAIVNSLIESMEQQPHPDLIRDLAFPLPMRVISELLGVPSQAANDILAWSNTVMRFIEAVSDDHSLAATDANRAVMEMIGFLEPLVAARRLSREDDFLSLFVQLVDHAEMTMTALYGWCLLFMIAGHESTAGLIGNAVVTMLTHPDAAEKLRKDPSRIERAIEEVLRFDSPVDRQTRLATEDLTLGGRDIRAGSRIYALLAAANRDPAVFPDPDTFDIERWPNRHLGFGYGIHFCLGAYLARLEARTAVGTLLNRYPNLRLAGQPKRRQAQTMRRYESIPIDPGTPQTQAATPAGKEG